jgi:hypothetical protein
MLKITTLPANSRAALVSTMPAGAAPSPRYAPARKLASDTRRTSLATTWR